MEKEENNQPEVDANGNEEEAEQKHNEEGEPNINDIESGNDDNLNDKGEGEKAINNPEHETNGDKQLNKDNVPSNLHEGMTNEINQKLRETNGTEERKDNQYNDNELLRNLSNDSFEKKFNQLREKLISRQPREMTTEDRLNLNLNSKGTANPKLEEIFLMIGAKDIKRELRELNKKPDSPVPDTRNYKFEIRNIHNYSPQQHFTQNNEKKLTYTSVIQVQVNRPPKHDQFNSNIQSFLKVPADKKEKRYASAIAMDKIIPRKRSPLFSREYFKAELSSLNQKLFGSDVNRNKRTLNSKEGFYL